MPNDVVAKPPADPSTGAGVERPHEAAASTASPPEGGSTPPGPPDDGAGFPPTPATGLNRARNRMALKIPDDNVPARPQGAGLRATGEGDVSPLLGMRIITLGEGALPSPLPAPPKGDGRAISEPPRGPTTGAPPPPAAPPSDGRGAALGRGRASSIPPPPPPRPPSPAIIATAFPSAPPVPAGSPGLTAPFPRAAASGASAGGANLSAGADHPGAGGGPPRPSATGSMPPRPRQISSPFLEEPLFGPASEPQPLPPPRAHQPTRPWDGRSPVGGDTNEARPAPKPEAFEARPAPRPGAFEARSAAQIETFEARPVAPTEAFESRPAPKAEAFESRPAPKAEAFDAPPARAPLPSFPIDDEETDQSQEEALTTQPISFPPPSSGGPDIEVEISVEEGPPLSEELPPESGPGHIGTLSADAEAELADALSPDAEAELGDGFDAPGPGRPTIKTDPPGPEGLDVDGGPESVEVDAAADGDEGDARAAAEAAPGDDGPEIEAAEGNEADVAEAYAGAEEADAEEAEAEAYGGPESVDDEAVEEDLDATHEMSALDLAADDEAEEADEDELEEVDDAEVQSDPRPGRGREPPPAYASSVRLADAPRGSTPPAPPARSGREEPLELRSKRRARPWWEELFDDDFLRATPRPTDGQVLAEASFIEARLGLAKGALILDLACGHGRHAIELTRRGYQVVGFDLSLAMLAQAADEAEAARQKVNFLHGDMRELPFEDKFDGIYCWGTSFGFFEEEKNLALLQRVYRALRPGGVFLLEAINRDFIAARQPSLVWYEGDGCLCMDEAQVDFITSRLKVKRTIMLDDGRTREVDYSLRLYGLHELGKMLHEAGFRVIEVSGRLATPGIFFGADSPQCIVLAERD